MVVLQLVNGPIKVLAESDLIKLLQDRFAGALADAICLWVARVDRRAHLRIDLTIGIARPVSPFCIPAAAASHRPTDYCGVGLRKLMLAMPTARLTPDWPCTLKGCKVMEFEEPPTNSLAPPPTPTAASAVAPT